MMNEGTNGKDSTTTGTKSPGGHRDQQQMDIGTYQLYQGSTLVGELLVTEDPSHTNDGAYRVEHWGLYSSYQWPSSRNTAVTTEFRYTTASYGSSVTDFITHMRTITGARYIKASCAEQSL